MKHVPALDGVRAIAIALVLGFHGYIPFLQGGQIGVDIFFVLSGYLITSLLLLELKATDRIGFIRFYIRRALRLYPALLVMLGLVLLYDCMFVQQGYLREVIFSGLYLMDYGMAFDHVRTFTPLSHTWSLAVEEHFYILWPPLLLWLWRRYPAEKLITFLSAAVGVSLAWFLLSAYCVDSWLNVYLRFDTRLTGLLLGCLLAACRIHGKKIPFVDEGLALFSALLGLWVVAAPHNLAYHAVSAIVIVLASFFAFFLIAKITEDEKWVVSQYLGSAIPAFIGKISYGVYLFHILISSAAAHFLGRAEGASPWFVTAPIMIVGSFALATVSWYTVEAVARHVGKKYKRNE